MAELWPGGIEYSDGGAFPVTTDSILLADFVRVRPYSAVLELCCGAGLISLLLHHRAPGISVCAVELDAASAAAAERLVSVFEALTAARLMPKRLRFVQHRAASAPGLMLCEAVKGAGPDGLRVETPLVLYEENGTESAEFRRIYHMEEQDGR